jgi:hypothetical protein
LGLTDNVLKLMMLRAVAGREKKLFLLVVAEILQ